jgi:hypothetical protein
MNVLNTTTRPRGRTGIRNGLLAGLTAAGLLASGTAGFAQALQAPNNLSDVNSATKSIQNLFNGQIIGIQPEAFGALRNGTADDTKAFVDAANYAALNRRGLTLSSVGPYKITPIQFGGSNPTMSGTFSGSITGGTTLNVTSTPSIPLAPGQTIACSFCVSGTTITGYADAKTGGWIGSYTITPSQTGGTSTSITATAASFTGSISGTTLTLSTAVTGQLNLYDSLDSPTTVHGTTIVQQLTSTTYRVSISQPTAVVGEMFYAYPVTVVPLPDFILGAPGGETATVLSAIGGNPTTALVNIVDPPALGAVLGFEIGNVRIDAGGAYATALQFHGFAATSSGGVAYAHDITVSGAAGATCGMNAVGNTILGQSWGVIEASFARISSVGNDVCDFNFDGNDGDGTHNVQGVFLESLRANSISTGNGFNVNYAELTCVECGSQNHGGLPLHFDNVYHNIWTNFYSEANGGQVTGTSNSLGVHITGKVQEGINATLLACGTCDIDVAIGSGVGAVSRNFGLSNGIGIAIGGDTPAADEITGRNGIDFAYRQTGMFGFADATGWNNFNNKPLTLFGSGIGTTSTPELTLSNAAAATSTVMQWSPAQRFSGNAWDTASGSSKRVDWKVENQTFSTGTGPVGYLLWGYQVNNGGYATVGYLSPAGLTLTSSDLLLDPNRAVRIGSNGDNALSGDGSSFIRVGTGAARDLQLYAGGGGAARITILNATGNVGIGTTTPAMAQNGFRNLTVNGSVQTAWNSVAFLPTCNANTEGSHYGVNDAPTPPPAFLAVVSTTPTGGTTHMSLYCNGTNWIAN